MHAFEKFKRVKRSLDTIRIELIILARVMYVCVLARY